MTTSEQMITELRSRDAYLRNLRNDYIPVWTDIRDYLHPRGARFEGEETSKGQRFDKNIINSNPKFAVRTLPAGLQSGLTSPLRPWFRLSMPDPELSDFAPVKEWLFDTESRMREVLSKSNIYDKLKSNYGILGSYGTSLLWLDDDQRDIMRAHDLLIGRFSLASDSTGRVSTMHRDMEMSVIQIIGRFKERAPLRIKEQYDRGNYHYMYKMLHVVQPNANWREGSMLPQYKPYNSLWIDCHQNGNESVLGFGGYGDIPFFAPRWDVIGENVYGVGCGEDAIGDAKQLQLMEKRKLQGVDKNVRPPMVADSSLRNHRTSHTPGDTTYVNGLAQGGAGYKPAYQIDPRLGELRVEIQAVEARVDEAYYKNLFQLIADIGDQPNITATQINAMREEKLLLLGPVLERLNDELLDPLIDRVFNIMQKRGLIAPPPEEIQDMPLRIEYISVLAQAQKALGIGNIERYVGFVGQMASVDPSAVDRLDADEIIEEYADGMAVPPKLVRTREEADERRQAAAQQQQIQEGIASSQGIAQVAKDLSQTNLSGDNAAVRAIEAINGGI